MTVALRSRRARVALALTGVALALELAVLSQARNLGGLVVLGFVAVTLVLGRAAMDASAPRRDSWLPMLWWIPWVLMKCARDFFETWGPRREDSWPMLRAAALLALVLGVLAMVRGPRRMAGFAWSGPRSRYLKRIAWGFGITVAAIAGLGSFGLAMAPLALVAWTGILLDLHLHERLPDEGPMEAEAGIDGAGA